MRLRQNVKSSFNDAQTHTHTHASPHPTHMPARLDALGTVTTSRRPMWHACFDATRPDVAFAACADGTTTRVRCVLETRMGKQYSSWSNVEHLSPHERAVRACAVSPCGRMLATASFDGTCGVFVKTRGDAVMTEEDDGEDGGSDGETWRRACALEGHESEVKSCAWSPSGALLATCGRDRTVWVWEAHGEDEFECVAALHGHGGDVKRVVWHPTEDVLVSVSYDESVRIWKEDADGDDWSCAKVLGGEDAGGEAAEKGHQGTVWCASFEPREREDGVAGTRAVTCGGDGALIVWNGAGFCNTDLDFATRFPCGHDRAVLACAWGKHGVVAAGGGDNSIRLYAETNDGTWREIASVPNAHDDDVNHVEWSPHDSSLLISASDDGTVKTWRYVAA